MPQGRIDLGSGRDHRQGLPGGSTHSPGDGHSHSEPDPRTGEAACRIRGRGRNRRTELILLVAVQIAEHTHARAGVERALHLIRYRDVHDEELREVEPVGVVDPIQHRAAQLLGQARVARGEVHDGYLRGGHDLRELGCHDRAEENLDLIGLEGAVGADQLGQQRLGLRCPERICSEPPHAQRPELRIAQKNGVRSAPLELGDLPGRDEIDLGFEGAVESVRPAAKRGQ